MALASFLRSQVDHEGLPPLLRRWPTALYDGAALLRGVMAKLRPGGDAAAVAAAAAAMPSLALAAALLHATLGQQEEAYRLYLALRDPAAFDHVAMYPAVLLPLAASRAADLVAIDEDRAVDLLAEHRDRAPPLAATSSLRAASEAAGEGSGPDRDEAVRVWRTRLLKYLDRLFDLDPSAAAPFGELQVELLADFDPGRLLHFLVASSSYPLDKAHKASGQKTRSMEGLFGPSDSLDVAVS
jgi:hypothetical protein